MVYHGSIDEGCCCRRVGLLTVEDVAVHVEREAGARVPEAFTHHAHVRARSQKVRRVGVPEPVEREAVESEVASGAAGEPSFPRTGFLGCLRSVTAWRRTSGARASSRQPRRRGNHESTGRSTPPPALPILTSSRFLNRPRRPPAERLRRVASRVPSSERGHRSRRVSRLCNGKSCSGCERVPSRRSRRREAAGQRT